MAGDRQCSNVYFIDVYISYFRTQEYKNEGYWKLYALLLYKEDYSNKMREIIKEIENDESVEDNMRKWEFTKFKMREFSINFSRELNTKKREYESKLLQEITRCCSETVLNDQEKS